ncbi:hypothetical protein DSL72_005330 [Monilinia vaccinii-corymbosi]|uniref:Uncharacterized protein n=1 Tax=Monilinia vaccinii-corymbosi TaxID=61207 RepID=A0A8A3PFB7_9HELO|nr:hypothetical protein DSL72_005330 [Monilinia vaccinii-corymbosi]
MDVDDDGYSSSHRRTYSADKDNGTMRSGDRSDGKGRSSEKTSSTNFQSFNSNNSSLPRITTNVAEPKSEGRRIEESSRSNSTTDSMAKSPVKSNNQESCKTELISVFTNLADLISSRSIVQQVEDSTRRSLKDQLEEIDRMAGAMKSFPTHKSGQNRRKEELEEILKTATEKIDNFKDLEKQAIDAIASRIIVKAAPSPLDKSTKILQERCLELEDRVKELERTLARMDQREAISKIKDRLEDFESKQRDIVGKLHTSQAALTGKIETRYRDLSKICTKLEEEHRATRIDIDSTMSRLDSHNISVQENAATIDISKKEIVTLQQKITENFATTKAKDNDIDQLFRKVADLQTLLNTHQSSFDHLNSSNHLERLSQVENTKTIVAELQRLHESTLANIENCQVDLSALKDKVTHIERLPPQAPSTPAPQVTPTLSRSGPNTTMLGVMQNKILNLQRDVKNLQERSSETNNLSLSQDGSLIDEQLNKTQLESRLNELEDSIKEVRCLSINKSAKKESPFSTTAREQTELKNAFEIYRAEQSQADLVTNQRVEGLKTDMQAIREGNIITQDQINAIEEKFTSISQIQGGMKELLNRFTESSTQMEVQLNDRLNSLMNSQNGNTLAITQLNSRLANISTADLAKNMLGQLETFYPNIRHAETTLLKHKDLLLDHTAQFATLKSQITALESQTVRKQSPAPTSNRIPESLRQEVDALSRDQIQLEADTKTNKTSLAVLEDDNTIMKAALDSLTKRVREENLKKRLDSLEEAFSDGLAVLSVKVDGLLAVNDNTRGFAAGTPLPSRQHPARQSSAEETAMNGKKRRVATDADSAKPSGSTNGYTQSPSRKRAKRPEDDNEDVESPG